MADGRTATLQLIIRDNLEAARDAFGVADVRNLDASSVRVGNAPECECAVDSGDLAAVHYTLDVSDEPGRWRLTPHPQCPSPVFLNGEPIREPVDVRSGDELRVGHLTFRLQRVVDPTSQGRRTGLVEATAKALLCLTLLTETLLVAWLPRQLRSARMWGLETAQYRATMLLDSLRKDVRLSLETEPDLAESARQLLADELGSMARVLRERQEQLSLAQWQQVQADLLEYQTILERIRDGKAFQPVPEVDVETGVRWAVGGRAGRKE